MKSALNRLRGLVSGKGLIRDVSYTAIGQVVVMVLMLLFNKVMSGVLQPDEFGIFTIANKASTFIAFIMVFGLGIALPVYLARYRTKGNIESEVHFLYASLIIMTSAIAGAFLLGYVFRTNLSLLLFGEAGGIYVTLVVPLLFLSVATALSTYIYSYYRGIDRFGTFNLIQIGLQIVALASAVIFGANIAMQFSVRGILVGFISLIVITLILMGYRKIKINGSKIRKNVIDVFRYTYPRVPGDMILFALTSVPLVLINHKYGLAASSSAAVGVTVLALATPLFQFIGMALLPHASRKVTSGKTGDLSITISKLRKLYLLVSVATFLGIFIFTEFLIRILFNAEYEIFASSVRIMAFGCIPYAMYLLLRNPIDAISRKPLNTFNLFCSFVVMIAVVLVSDEAWVASLAFPLAYLVLGIMSEVSWRILVRRRVALGVAKKRENDET